MVSEYPGVILEGDLGEKVSLSWLTYPYLELREKWKCIESIGKSKIWTKTSPWNSEIVTKLLPLWKLQDDPWYQYGLIWYWWLLEFPSNSGAFLCTWGWSGGAKVSRILCHRGVQLILAYSWARPAILVAGKGRGGMFLFLLFLQFHSCSSFFPVPLFHRFDYLFYHSSPFLWETTQNDPQGLTHNQILCTCL